MIKKKRKKIYIILGVIILGIIFFIFQRKNNENDITYQMKKDTVSDELVFAGVVDADRRVDLGFAQGGRIIKNRVKEGDWVKKGTLLAEVDQSAIRAGLIQANAQYQLTKVDTKNKIENSTSSYEEIKKEQDTLVKNAYTQYISGDLQAVLDDNNVAHEIIAPRISGNYLSEKEGVYHIKVYKSAAQSGYSFKLSGLEKGTYTAETHIPGKLGELGLFMQLTPGVNYAYTEWDVEVPSTRSTTYLARKTAYENARAQRDKILSDAQNNKDLLTKKIIGTDLSYSDALVKSARAQMNANLTRLSDGKIIAPFDGYVVKNNLEKGETAQALIPQITLFASKKRKIILNTPELYINKIHLNDEVKVTLDAYPDISFIGHIIKIDDIDTLVDGVPVYETEVLMDDIDERMRVGMNAHASIVVAKKEDVLAIPKHFVTAEREENYVWLKKKNKKEDLEKRKVTLGLEGNNGLVEIVSGLHAGDVVIFKKEK